MRVHVVDPSAYTPPYDDALCQALGEAGVEVELVTSRFAYGEVGPPQAYARCELFYPLSHRASATAPRSRARKALKLAEHLPGMVRYMSHAKEADVVHFQWLTAQPLDAHLLPRRPSNRRPALVLTAHDILPREPAPGQVRAQRRLYDRMDGIVVHSVHGRERLIGELGVAPDRVTVIAHGLLRPWANGPAQLPDPFAQAQGQVVLFIGLLRGYKGLDTLVQAWHELGQVERHGAELWIVGMPRMEMDPLHGAIAQAQQAGAGPIRLLERFVSAPELLAFLERASLVVLPYRQIDQSGVAFTALGAGKPLLLSDVGGFPELASTGAAATVPAGDPQALRNGLARLLEQPRSLAAMATRARALRAPGAIYSWQTIAQAHIDLYERLLAGR